MTPSIFNLIIGLLLLSIAGCDADYLDTALPLADPWNGGDARALQASKSKQAGADIYDACASCHISDGAGRADGTVPRLAGQHTKILQQKLLNLQHGKTDLPAMLAFANALSPHEITQVSDYIAALPSPQLVGQGPGTNLQTGAERYQTFCAACHGMAGEGNVALLAPKLCGQHYGYILRRTEEIATNRRGDADAAMVAMMAPLPATDLAFIADHLSQSDCKQANGDSHD